MNTQKRRIMRDFTITELSACDRPAQEHALMTIMKRDNSKETTMQFQKITSAPASFATFESAMEAIRHREQCSATEAMSKAAAAHPDLLAKFNDEGLERAEEAAADVAKAASKPRAVTDFEMLVSAIAERDGVSRTRALQIARTEHPAEFSAFQRA